MESPESREHAAEAEAPPETLRRDGAAPHQAPASSMPRWLAWIVLIALVASGGVCAWSVIGV